VTGTTQTDARCRDDRLGARSAPPAGSSGHGLIDTVRYDFAQSTRIVYLVMAGVMALSFFVAARLMVRGRPEEVAHPADELPEPVAARIS
jgi:hypothetical protein